MRTLAEYQLDVQPGTTTMPLIVVPQNDHQIRWRFESDGLCKAELLAFGSVGWQQVSTFAGIGRYSKRLVCPTTAQLKISVESVCSVYVRIETV